METDSRENIEVDITDDEFLAIAKLAHKRDITINKMIEIIIQTELDRIKDEENA